MGGTLVVVEPLLRVTPVLREDRTHVRLDDWCGRVPPMPKGRPYMTRPARGGPSAPIMGRALCGLDASRTPNVARAPGDRADAPDGTAVLCRVCERELVMAIRVLQGLRPFGPLEAVGRGTGLVIAGSEVALHGLLLMGLDMALAIVTDDAA